ncbi:hypothetical protein [Galbibacter pacificus]|uniref:Secreted protein n=1 Tax=Galbibacter pacificus TaxID=2996052 RepID=A0ABT6FQF4_9FLAO|nr:hypothetical protein [Galbibacter pacificus]MDG3582026.1 hypothetical protein [Galbibacter pacificus]MDG3585500.1 hypothetical protein [Galbibacter pacificus]
MKVLFTLIVLLIGLNTYAQGDLPNTPIPLKGLGATEQPNNETPEEKPLDIKAVPDINVPEAPKEKTAVDIANKEVNLMDSNEAFLDAGDRFDKKLNREYNRKDGEKLGATTTQYFGDFKTNSKTVKILCRDHGNIDGDRVSIIINDKVVVPNVFLEGSFKGFYFDLQPGFNKIEFRALNEGAYSPNTAQFAVFDDKGGEISANEWNLNTNVKASLLIIKE